MLSADESAELRSLQAKAYGRGGGLTTAEVARLQELERLRLPAVAQPVSSPTAPQPALNDPQETDSPQGADSRHRADPTRDVERAEGETKRGERPKGVEASATPTRRRWLVIAAASVAILAIGVGIGWAIWGWNAEAYALAAAHADQRAELEAGEEYDSGTVTPVAEQYGVVIWRADRSDGDEVCVIVTAASQTQSGCAQREKLGSSAWTNASITVPKGEEKAGQQLSAALIMTPAGELVPFIQVWDQSASGWESQYNDDELAQLRELEAAGYNGSALSIIGYDGDTVVWGSSEHGNLCVIAPTDTGLLEACAEDPESELTLAVLVDGAPTEYVVRQTGMGGPQLTIVRQPALSTLETDRGSGDPIEFTFDDPTFDDLVIDGETGTTGETGG